VYIGTHRHALVKQFDALFDFIFFTEHLIINSAPSAGTDTIIFEELQTGDFQNQLSPVSGTNRSVFELEPGNYNLILSGTTERTDLTPLSKQLRLNKSSDVNAALTSNVNAPNKETIIEIDPDGPSPDDIRKPDDSPNESFDTYVIPFDETVNFTIDTKPFITLELTYNEGLNIDFDLTYRFERTGLL